MTTKYEVVFCVVNSGFSETVMESARSAGARGGTILTATGTANPQSEKFFGITVKPNKEIVMILVDANIKENVLHNLYRDVGLNTAGQGIAFTLPVNDVAGLTPVEQQQEQQEQAQQEQQTTEQTQEEPRQSDDASDTDKD